MRPQDGAVAQLGKGARVSAHRLTFGVDFMDALFDRIRHDDEDFKGQAVDSIDGGQSGLGNGRARCGCRRS